jgi:hypothetical protein
MANSNLTEAQRVKNDEFYTQYHDIEKEISAYLEFNPDVFRGKTVLLPCDDPEWSNFTKFFAQNFKRFGLKKLVSTSYAVDSKTYKNGYQPTLFEINDPQYDKIKTIKNGKIFTLTHDKTGDHKVNVDDLEWHYLTGDGDFRSTEIKKLRDESDIIITNPPFSLFREFLAWTVDSKNLFVIIGNKNCVTYKEVFPLIKENRLWSGRTEWSGGMWFETKDHNDVDTVIDGVNMKNVSSVWLTNIDHGRRHEPLPLMTMADNLKFSKHKEIKGKKSYDVYDNYDAIEVPFTDSIPSDYDGAMGVPISFLDKYSPEQFEIMGITDRDNNSGLKTREYTEEDVPNSGDLNRRGVIKIGSEYKSTYARLLIRRKPKK